MDFSKKLGVLCCCEDEDEDEDENRHATWNVRTLVWWILLAQDFYSTMNWVEQVTGKKCLLCMKS